MSLHEITDSKCIRGIEGTSLGAASGNGADAGYVTFRLQTVERHDSVRAEQCLEGLQAIGSRHRDMNSSAWNAREILQVVQTLPDEQDERGSSVAGAAAGMKCGKVVRIASSLPDVYPVYTLSLAGAHHANPYLQKW